MRVIACSVLLAGAGLLALSSRALAGEETQAAEESAGGAEGEEESGGAAPGATTPKTLAERIPSVTRRSFAKEGRLEVYPSVGLALNDPFYNDVIFTGGLTFHALEWLSFGLAGDYFLALPTDPTVTNGGTALDPEIDHPTYSARLEVGFAPLYGKLSLFAETVLHFDTYLIVGGGVLGTVKGSPGPVGVVGLGQHFFIGRFLALRLELRDQIFQMSRDAVTPGAGKDLQNLLTATLGFCFYLPTDFDYEAL